MESNIIIKGGSVSLTFDENILRKISSNPSVYSHPTSRVKRIKIMDLNGTVFDYSCEHGIIEINIEYE